PGVSNSPDYLWKIRHTSPGGGSTRAPARVTHRRPRVEDCSGPAWTCVGSMRGCTTSLRSGPNLWGAEGSLRFPQPCPMEFLLQSGTEKGVDNGPRYESCAAGNWGHPGLRRQREHAWLQYPRGWCGAHGGRCA